MLKICKIPSAGDISAIMFPRDCTVPTTDVPTSIRIKKNEINIPTNAKMIIEYNKLERLLCSNIICS